LGTPCSAIACKRVSTSSRSLISRSTSVNWFQRPEAQLALMARVLQYLTAFKLKFAQVGHLFARHSGAQPLFSDGVFVLLPGKAHFTRMNFKEFCQRVATKRVLQPFFRIRTSTCSPSPSGAKPILNHHEVFRIGF
jgi:hypothetical protein